MTRALRRTSTPFLLLAPILFIAGGCNPFSPDTGTDPGPGGGEEVFNRITPALLLTDFFGSVYAAEDSARYDEMLLLPRDVGGDLSGGFEFVFLEADRDSADLPPGEVSWGRSAELRSAGAMFRAPRVISVILELTPLAEAVPDNGIYPDKPAGEVWFRMNTDTDLRVTVADPAGIDDTIFTVTNQQEFIMAPDPRPEHAGKWQLRVQRELDVVGRSPRRPGTGTDDGTHFSSWGALKAHLEREGVL